MNISFKDKYLKYKKKYLELCEIENLDYMIGGAVEAKKIQKL